MLWLDRLAEQRVAEAEQRGELRGLAGSGQPLNLDDDCGIPATSRVAYRIMKNAGCVPPEVAALREVRELSAILRGVDDDGERRHTALRLTTLLTQLGERGERLLTSGYYEQLREQLAGARTTDQS